MELGACSWVASLNFYRCLIRVNFWWFWTVGRRSEPGQRSWRHWYSLHYDDVVAADPGNWNQLYWMNWPLQTQLDCRGACIARPNACRRRGRQRRISKHYLSNRCFYLSNGACARCESGSITRVAWVEAAKAARCGQFPTLSTPKYAKCTRSIVSQSQSRLLFR